MYMPFKRDIMPNTFINPSRLDEGDAHRNNTPNDMGKINRAFTGFIRLV